MEKANQQTQACPTCGPALRKWHTNEISSIRHCFAPPPPTTPATALPGPLFPVSPPRLPHPPLPPPSRPLPPVPQTNVQDVHKIQTKHDSVTYYQAPSTLSLSLSPYPLLSCLILSERAINRHTIELHNPASPRLFAPRSRTPWRGREGHGVRGGPRGVGRREGPHLGVERVLGHRREVRGRVAAVRRRQRLQLLLLL